MYVLKQAMLMKAIEPDFTAVWKEVEANSNKQCLDRSEACYEDG